MRKILTVAIALGVVVMAAPTTTASDTASGPYTLGLGGVVWHGLPSPVSIPIWGNNLPQGLALSLCAIDGIPGVEDPDGQWDHCFGGRSMVTTECQAIFIAGGDCEEEATRYMVAELSVVDGLSGNNILASICLWHPDGDSTCSDGDATTDGVEDARASGCGTALIADANGLAGHTGNFRVTAFAWSVSVDPFTNQVCVATTGDFNVVFS